MNVTVIGAGNIGTHFAVQFGSKGHDVTIFASKPERISREIYVVNSEGEILRTSKLKNVTSDMAEAVKDADYIFVTHPAFMLKATAEKMLGNIKEGAKIGVVPGTGGAEFAFKPLIAEGAVLFGLQRVPAVARLTQYGKAVCVEGARPLLHIAAIPRSYAQEISEVMSKTFDVGCKAMDNYLSVTLTPSNPILHTTRLRTEFADYKEGVVYPKNILFYEEWSEDSSELLINCDEELQQICRKLDKLDLSDVKSLKLHYESDTSEKLTAKIRSIKSLQGLGSPMKEVGGGFVPDFSSRYFTADFPYGLAILVEMGNLTGVDTPYMDETLKWYEDMTENISEFKLSSFGINTVEDLYSFYCN